MHKLNPKYQTQDLSRICQFLDVRASNVFFLLTLSCVLSLNVDCAQVPEHARHTLKPTGQLQEGHRLDFLEWQLRECRHVLVYRNLRAK